MGVHQQRKDRWLEKEWATVGSVLPQAAEDRSSRARSSCPRAPAGPGLPRQRSVCERLGVGMAGLQVWARSLNLQDEVVALQCHVCGYMDLADSAFNG